MISLKDLPLSVTPNDGACRWIRRPDGVEIALYDLSGGAANGPALLFGHCTGFSAGSYVPLLRAVQRSWPVLRVFAFDARGHGASTSPDLSLGRDALNDQVIAQDLAAAAATVREMIGPAAPLHYAAHSLGATAALGVYALLAKTPFASLTLFEPPILPPHDHPLHDCFCQGKDALAKGAAQRRSAWPDAESLAFSLARNTMFQNIAPELLLHHARAVLRPDPTAHYTLSCRPAVEAATFAAFDRTDLWFALPQLRRIGPKLPIRVVVSDLGRANLDPVTAITPDLAQSVQADLIAVPSCGHMLCFERPAAFHKILMALREA